MPGSAEHRTLWEKMPTAQVGEMETALKTTIPPIDIYIPHPRRPDYKMARTVENPKYIKITEGKFNCRK